MSLFDVLAAKEEPEPEANPWAMLTLEPALWNVEKMFEAHRGGPIFPTTQVMLATPAYTNPSLEFLHSRDMVLADLVQHNVSAIVLTSPGDSLVMRGRHTLMHAFLCSTATHLLFWDVDIEVTEPSIVRQMLGTGHDIVGGACPFRDPNGRVVCNLREEDKRSRRLETDDFGCVKVSEVGTGFLLMSRKAIVRLCEAHPELQYFSDLPSGFDEPMWALFDTMIVGKRFLSEDYFFCKLWRDLGGDVHVYVPFEAAHWGKTAYRANFMAAWKMKEA